MPTTTKSYIKYTPWTEGYIWSTMQEFNTWHGQMYVEMAGVCDPGVVRKAELVSYAPEDIAGDYYQQGVYDGDGNITQVYFVTKTRTDSIETELAKLRAAMESLITKLTNAGIMSSDPTEICE